MKKTGFVSCIFSGFYLNIIHLKCYVGGKLNVNSRLKMAIHPIKKKREWGFRQGRTRCSLLYIDLYTGGQTESLLLSLNIQ